ncbi:MAG TPA: restriction endonuclease subunit S, partial [Aquella sp.]|nr:restriction endonuclease subunit S [Aquella sp.]
MNISDGLKSNYVPTKLVANNTKKSELGPIPTDWTNSTFGEALTGFSSGSTPSRLKPEFFKGDILWITSGELNYNVVNETKEKITEDAVKAANLKILDPGTFLIAITGLEAAGTRGSCAIVGKKATTNQSCMALYPKKHLDLGYLFHFYVYYGERLAFRYCQGTKQQSYNAEIARILPLNYPEINQQKIIAYILGLMDNAININNQLIAQKELRNKWLMQNLLTGKKRLNGFSGEWNEEKLGKLFNQIKNVNDGGNSHSIMTISSKLGLISQEAKFDRVIAGDSLKKYTQLRKEDFAYNKGNSKTYQMGCIYQLENHESALVPFVYICFSPTELVDAKFYKHWFLAHGLDRQLNKIITSGARGDGLLNVNTDDFFNLKIIYPP